MTELARSLLFVPGSRPERFEKAAASGADAVILDLEDAVPAADKRLALERVTEWLRRGHPAVVRINARGTPWHDEEIAALVGVALQVMVPKAEDAQALSDLARRLNAELIALIETARGVQAVDAIAAAPGVTRLAVGTIDLAAELGVDPRNGSALAYARGRVAMASAAAGLSAPIDGVTTAFDDLALVAADAAEARALGYGAKLCIHPRQVEAVHDAFRPLEHELQWAERVLAAAEEAGGGAVAVDGSMVDAPVVARARDLLARGREPTSGRDASR